MRRKLLLLILIPGVLLISGYLFLQYSLRSSVKEEEDKTGEVLPKTDSLGGKKVSKADVRSLLLTRMEQLLRKSSNGLYDLSVGDLQIDVLNSTLVLKKVVLQPGAGRRDSLQRLGKLPQDVYAISFDRLDIDGINLDDAVTSKTMDYRLIKLVNPVITIHHRKGEKQVNEEDFSQRFLREMKKLSIKRLVVEGGTVTIRDGSKKGAANKLNNVTIDMNNFLLDSTTRNQKDRFLFAERATVSFSNFSKPTRDGMYWLKIEKVTVKSPAQEAVLGNVSFTSPYNRGEFTRRQKQSKELYNLTLPAVSIHGVSWWSLLNEEEIVADAITAKGGKLSIYLDRSLPPKNKMGNFPNQLVKKLPVRLHVARMNLSGLDLSYTEYNPISQQTGTVYMDNVALAVNNLSNTSTQPMIVKGSALFMHQVPLQSTFTFDMAAARTGKFSATIQSEGFDASLINAFAMPMGLMKMEKGTLHSAEATITGDQYKASGKVFIPYEDLKLSLLEKDKGEKELDKKGVTTLLANLFVLKKNNPREGKGARREQAAFTRIPEGGFFMLVWKTMLVGALKTIGAPEKIAYKTAATAKKK